MISHAEAEALISARLDGPLDPVAERELITHLTTCAHCRHFAEQSNQLAQGLRDIPYLPASPAVSRVVLAHINKSRSPFAWIRNIGGFQVMPVFSAVATVLIVIALGAFVFNRIDRTNTPLDSGTGDQTAQSQVTRIVEIEAPETGITPTSSSLAAESGLAETEPTPTSETAAPDTTVDATEPVFTKESAATEAPPTNESSATESGAPEGFAPTLEPTAESGALDESDPTTEPVATTEDQTTFQVAGQDDNPTETPAPEQVATEPAPVETATLPAQPEPTQTMTIIPGGEIEPTATTEDKGRPGTSGGQQSFLPPDATATDEPTATTPPEPTATDEPTATIPPEPTATDEPTATIPPEPTATDEPTATIPPEPTATDEPTATIPPEPTATDEPTATIPPEPTATDEPEPTATEVESGMIVPIDGTFASIDETPVESETPEDTTGQLQPTAVAIDETGAADEESPESSDGTGVIEPSGGPNTDNTGETSGDSTIEGESGADTGETPEGSSDIQLIEPSDTGDGGETNDPDIGAASNTPEPSGGDDQNGSGDQGIEPTEGGDNQRNIVGGRGGVGSSLESVAQPSEYGSFDGDTHDMSLATDNNNNLVLTQVPAFTWLQRPDGYSIGSGYSDAGEQGIQICDPSQRCTVYSYEYDNEQGVDRDAAGISDVPVAWLGDAIVFMHITNDGVTYRSVEIDLSSFGISNEQELLTGDSSLEETVNGAFYGMNGVLIPVTDQWLYLALDGSSQILGGNPFANISLVRVHESLGVITYVGDGQLVIANLDDPGNVRGSLAFNVGDYDLSPGGDQFVISTGSGMQIVDTSGGVIADYPAEGQIAPGGVLWVDSGILFVDVNTGDVLLIPHSALP